MRSGPCPKPVFYREFCGETRSGSAVEVFVEVIPKVACTVCGCVCGDRRLLLEEGRVVGAEGVCRLAEPWFLGQGGRHPPVAPEGVEGDDELSGWVQRAVKLVGKLPAK
jgi:hypothetical protein